MSNNNQQTRGGIGFFGLLTLICITLKLTGFISWSWVWVLAPMWISISVGLLIFIIIFLVAIFTD